MSNELPLPKASKVKPFKLSDLTCAELADILEQPAPLLVREPAKLRHLRSRLGNAFHIQCLRLAGAATALHWQAKIRSAALVANAPSVKLVFGHGIPGTIGQAGVRYTKTAAAMAKQAGITLHHFKGRAFTVLKSTPPPRKTLRMKNSNLLALVRRSGQATRRALARCSRTQRTPRVNPQTRRPA